MAYIVAQKIIKDSAGVITSGSAAIVESVYIKPGEKKYHCKHVVREKLGKVVWLSEDKKSGIFVSPTRGVVAYDSVSDEFSDVDHHDRRIENRNVIFKAPSIHTTFGDSFFMLQFLKESGMLAVLKRAFGNRQDLERAICHILHGILKDGSRISCGDFISKSFISYLLTNTPISSLDSDTPFFSLMGSDEAKMLYFRTFVSEMKHKYPNFGKCSYIDSTPLPNDIADNPLNFLCSHGLGAVSVQTRLVFVIDKETGLPVWFHIIPGNVLDFSTIKTILDDILDDLGVIVDELVLDAGYVTKNLFDAQDDKLFKTFIARMPAKNGFPYMKLYRDCKNQMKLGRYSFTRNSQVYFGIKKDVEIFEHKMKAYVYVDWLNAEKRRIEWEDKNPGAAEKMRPSELDWLSIQFGYFVLITEKDKSPKEILDEYYERTAIESVNKTAKDYAELLPLKKWSPDTVRGKILYDIINTTLILMMRKRLRETKDGEKNVRSLSYLYGKTQSLMCREHQGNIIPETPNKQTKEAFKLMKLELKTALKIKDMRKEFLGIEM